MPPFRSFLENHFERYQADQPEVFKTRLDFAVEVYRQRNLPPVIRKEEGWQMKYQLQPVGYYLQKNYEDQKHGVWLPHPFEVRPCCWSISTPQARYPHGWHRHCRSMVHVATICNVDLRELRKLIEKPRERCQLGCGRFAKKSSGYCTRCMFVHRLDGSLEPC